MSLFLFLLFLLLLFAPYFLSSSSFFLSSNSFFSSSVSFFLFFPSFVSFTSSLYLFLLFLLRLSLYLPSSSPFCCHLPQFFLLSLTVSFLSPVLFPPRPPCSAPAHSPSPSCPLFTFLVFLLLSSSSYFPSLVP